VAFLSNRTRLNGTPGGWLDEAPAVRLALLPLSCAGEDIWVENQREPALQDPLPRVLHFDLRTVEDRRSLSEMLSQDEIAVAFIDTSEGRLVRRALLEPEGARPELRRFLAEAELRFPEDGDPILFDLPS